MNATVLSRREDFLISMYCRVACVRATLVLPRASGSPYLALARNPTRRRVLRLSIRGLKLRPPATQDRTDERRLSAIMDITAFFCATNLFWHRTRQSALGSFSCVHSVIHSGHTLLELCRSTPRISRHFPQRLLRPKFDGMPSPLLEAANHYPTTSATPYLYTTCARHSVKKGCASKLGHHNRPV